MIEKLVQNKINGNRAKKILKKFPKAEVLGIGRHSVVLIENKICIKVEKDIVAANGAIEDEVKWLKKLQGNDWVAKLVDYDKKLRYVSYKYASGEFFPEFIEKATKKQQKEIILKCLEICRELDKLKINKKEMHKPVKHIIVNYPKVKFIDWERCYETERPKNVTQFVNYLVFRERIVSEKIMESVKKYKKSYSDEDFENVCQIAHRSS